MCRTLSHLLNISISPKTEKWKKLVENKQNPKQEIDVAIAGKYTTLEDSYASVVEALKHCSANTNSKINIKWIDTTDENKIESQLKNIKAVIVPGGFGARGTEGKIKIIQYCRENNVPFLGICYGLQMAVVEYARNVCKLKDANSTEIVEKCSEPVIDILEEQKTIIKKGGTMRLGSYQAKILENSITSKIYNNNLIVYERHRHRYEVNPNYHKILEDNGLVISGLSPDRKLAEFIEISNHPYFIATQSHPELKSSLLDPSPLFLNLIKSALKKDS
jgi:CTP synthase